jgi:uncharacterized membrane protein
MPDESDNLPEPSGEEIPARPDPLHPNPTSPHAGSMAAVSARYYSGPIPDAESLARYERVFEGAAREIFDMAKDEAAFQREMERERLTHERIRLEHERIALEHEGVAVLADIKQGYLGTITATIVALAGFGMTCYLGYVTGALAATIVGSVGIGGIVYTIATGRKAVAKELAEDKSLPTAQPSGETLPAKQDPEEV